MVTIMLDYNSYSKEHSFELEHRMKNLMWSVSGDYKLQTSLDLDSFRHSKYICLYDAIKQGAFAKYFDIHEFSLYCIKKLYFSANESALIELSQLAIDMAIYKKIIQERMGVISIREKAFHAILDNEFSKLSSSFTGQLKIALLRQQLQSIDIHSYPFESRFQIPLQELLRLEQANSTMDIITCVDSLYNTCIDTQFIKKYGDLSVVLAVPLEDLKEFEWQDYLKEDFLDDQMEQYIHQLSNQLTNLSNVKEKKNQEQKASPSPSTILIDEDAIAKMYSYIELNHGTSYQTPLEQSRTNHRLCYGAHSDCKLYFTDGILKNPVRSNYQYKYALRAKEKNTTVYEQHYHITKQNIQILTDTLKRSLMLRNESETILGDSGTLLLKKLWNIGRTSNTHLFEKEIKKNSSEFVVDILIDSSGSQRDRQSQVALQGFIISEALSNSKIPHRVIGFCTFWDYTIMRRFRDYEDARSANYQIFEFYASSNNRDGLAIRAAADDLLQREEENKILIVLSDGKPNDIILNRPNSKNPKPYTGDYAVTDTAFEVRKLRSMGISVLGVFAGAEQDLYAERTIFGKDFAYIRSISNFSNIVGLYLKRQLDDI